MNRRAFLVSLVALGCSDKITTPFCGFTDDGSKLGIAAKEFPVIALSDVVSVGNFDDFRAALSAGHTGIQITAPLYVTEPVVLDEYPLPGSHFALVGIGGYNGSTIVRNFDGPEPVISAHQFGADGRERAWEIRILGITFYGHSDMYPDAGPSLELEYLQLSILDDVRFQYHSDRPFVLGARMNNAVEIRDLFIFDSGAPAQLLNAGDFRIRGGAIEEHSGGITGLDIHGPARGTPNSYPGPGVIEDVHQEFSRIIVHGVDDLSYRGGYRLGSEVHFNDCGGRFSFSPEGVWADSKAYKDGKVIYPVPC